MYLACLSKPLLLGGRTRKSLDRHRTGRPSPWRLAVALPLLLAASLATANPLATGAAAPRIALQDQHGKPVQLQPDTQRLLFTAERQVNDMVSKWLATQPAGLLEQQHTVFVADISSMPAVITRMFALPRMREWPFPVGLVREPAEVAQVAGLPRQPGAATVLRFADGRLTEIHLVRNESQLRAALGLAAD